MFTVRELRDCLNKMDDMHLDMDLLLGGSVLGEPWNGAFTTYGNATMVLEGQSARLTPVPHL